LKPPWMSFKPIAKALGKKPWKSEATEKGLFS
jgi:hypothetical protein